MNTVKTFILGCDFLSDGATFEKYYAAAPEYRRAKIDKIRYAADKRLSLGADILLKAALGDFAGMPVLLGEHGKPYIEGCPLKFSVSHSGSYAALAVGESEVGCDIQEMKSTFSKKTAQRFFTESENAFIAESGDDAAAFFRLWAIKESYIKMLGSGLQTPLDSFEVRFENGGAHINNKCEINEFFGVGGYSLAVCAAEKSEFTDAVILDVKE